MRAATVIRHCCKCVTSFVKNQPMGKLICPSPYISNINVIFFRVLVIVGNTLTGFQTFFGKMFIPFYLFRP